MSRIFVHGIGCVSPAGWGMASLREALTSGKEIAALAAKRSGSKRSLFYQGVPAAPTKFPFMSHPRLRRSSPLTVYAAAAALEALGTPRKGRRVGIVFCVTGGCVQFSRRFYDETWRDPAKASPLIFPETVFNAPSSHLSALLESPHINYTCIGDPATMVQGMGMAAEWIGDGLVDDCLVVGAEESDWVLSDAYRHFSRETVCAEGAGALLLSAEPAAVELERITEARLYLGGSEQEVALKAVREELGAEGEKALLCDSCIGVETRDRAECGVWSDWKGARISPKATLGEGLAAGAAWQCVAAVDALQRGDHEAAFVSVAGIHEHAIGARFARANA